MLTYISAKYAQLLKKNQLDAFEKVWDCKVNWVEEPNQNRGGWSGVGCLTVAHENTPVILFIKKQLNHTTRTLGHPLSGVPTFAKEFQTISFLKSKQLNVPELVFFGHKVTQNGQQAVLITESLAGYQSLDSIQKTAFSLHQQRQILRCVAIAIKGMHNAGVVHRALYAKHIFIKPRGDAFEVAMIDFEKARRIYFSPLQAANDLITLNYRTSGWGNTSRLYFLKQYLAQPNLNSWGKLFCKWVIYRSRQKMK